MGYILILLMRRGELTDHSLVGMMDQLASVGLRFISKVLNQLSTHVDHHFSRSGAKEAVLQFLLTLFLMHQV